MSLVKICGLSTPETLEAALGAGADMVGFVAFPNARPGMYRWISAAPCRGGPPAAPSGWLLVVDPTDRDLDEALDALAPELIQLHGRETPDRVADIRARTGRPVMKAIAIAEAADLSKIEAYRPVADRILLDAKPPQGADLPGGNGVAFDWRILDGFDRPFALRRAGPIARWASDPEARPHVGSARAHAPRPSARCHPGVRPVRRRRLLGHRNQDPRARRTRPEIAAFVRAARAAFAVDHRRAG